MFSFIDYRRKSGLLPVVYIPANSVDFWYKKQSNKVIKSGASFHLTNSNPEAYELINRPLLEFPRPKGLMIIIHKRTTWTKCEPLRINIHFK